MFDYIEENLEKIKNPNDVDIIKRSWPEGDKGYSLYARINNDELVQLTKPMGRMTFPFEPIYWLAREVFGKFYFNDFAILDNVIAINKNHLVKLGYVDENLIQHKNKRVGLYAYFDDGNIISFAHPTSKYFFKTWKAEIEQKCGMQFEDITEEVKQENELNQ